MHCVEQFLLIAQTGLLKLKIKNDLKMWTMMAIWQRSIMTRGMHLWFTFSLFLIINCKLLVSKQEQLTTQSFRKDCVGRILIRIDRRRQSIFGHRDSEVCIFCVHYLRCRMMNIKPTKWMWRQRWSREAPGENSNKLSVKYYEEGFCDQKNFFANFCLISAWKNINSLPSAQGCRNYHHRSQ